MKGSPVRVRASASKKSPQAPGFGFLLRQRAPSASSVCVKFDRSAMWTRCRGGVASGHAGLLRQARASRQDGLRVRPRPRRQYRARGLRSASARPTGYLSPANPHGDAGVFDPLPGFLRCGRDGFFPRGSGAEGERGPGGGQPSHTPHSGSGHRDSREKEHSLYFGFGHSNRVWADASGCAPWPVRGAASATEGWLDIFNLDRRVSRIRVDMQNPRG
jgi:hypothetical protein